VLVPVLPYDQIEKLFEQFIQLTLAVRFTTFERKRSVTVSLLPGAARSYDHAGASAPYASA
jgi:hypothetical protein